MSLPFHPIIQRWFADRFGEPTAPQLEGWPLIREGRHTLIAAPTGSGKTLAAFLCCIDELLRQALDGRLEQETQVVYISPLKALSNDIKRNLEGPLQEIQALAQAEGYEIPPLTALVRTGDTPTKDRQRMLTSPPHILVTTPESLYILLTSARSREGLRTVRTIIVDEIHAIADDKRGSHLSLSVERLAALCPLPPVRIGLSATQSPIELIAGFLVGAGHTTASGEPDCAIVDGGHVRELDLALETPPSDLSAVCSHEQWAEIYERICALVETHRSTLVFVNTRKLAERVCYCLSQRLGEDLVASHHGSLSREIRLNAEEKLKSGELKAIVATASLELGIDIGYVDLVVQIGSPKAIATFLQRVGRSGHHLQATPKGRLFPLTRDDNLEALAMVRAVRARRLDRIIVPESPADILAQQIVAIVAADDWDETALYELCRRAYPYRTLTREAYDRIIDMLSRGVDPKRKVGAYLHRDRVNNQLRARRGARLAAITAGGAIPDAGDFRVLTEAERTYVGTVNEDFAIESMAGDVFLLGNTSWMVRQVRNGEVLVMEVPGATPTIPFWLGEAPGRTDELSEEVSDLRLEIAARLGYRREAGEGGTTDAGYADPPAPNREAAARWLREACGADGGSSVQAVDYTLAQLRATGLVPSRDRLFIERFFDETGGQQLVIHSPYGSRINRAWGLALRKRFCRGFNFELQGSADENGVVLSLGLTHSFALDSVPKMLTANNARNLLEQALLATPIFTSRWRWNATRSLAVLRFRGGKRVPPNLQRFKTDDLLTGIFPQATACLENVVGDIELPDHPLVNQAMFDALQEALDCEGLERLLGEIHAGRVTAVLMDTREPSPFSHELINANPYAFLDDAPLEERRARAISLRRTLDDDLQHLAVLDAGAIAQVRADAWPLVRDADELHDALLSILALPVEEGGDWQPFYADLEAAQRATTYTQDGRSFWCAAECLPTLQALWPEGLASPDVAVPPGVETVTEPIQAQVELTRGRLQISGPLTAPDLAEAFGGDAGTWDAACSALEGEGFVLQGRFTPDAQSVGEGGAIEWCERRLLARIHRLTLDGLRRQIEPVAPETFQRYLLKRQHLTPDSRRDGAEGLGEILSQLQGFEAPAGAWEADIFAARLGVYDGRWLDELGLYGVLMWARLFPPQRRQGDSARIVPMNRAAPLAFVLRDDLDWLAPERPEPELERLHGHAKAVLDVLTTRGAMFFDDLLRASKLLPEQLENALAELMSAGLATPDTFEAVRNFATPKKSGQSAARRKKRQAVAIRRGGRWALFPGVELTVPTDATERWARLLLKRYGVVFRDLLARESVAPPWRVLAPLFRQLEARGEVRGGRFIKGCGGEQFAAPEVVAELRKLRDTDVSDRIAVLPAIDPANVSWLVSDDARIPNIRGNAVAVQAGVPVARKLGTTIEFLADLPLARQADIRKLLTMNAIHRSHDEAAAPPVESAVAVPDDSTEALVQQSLRQKIRRTPPKPPIARLIKPRAPIQPKQPPRPDTLLDDLPLFRSLE